MERRKSKKSNGKGIKHAGMDGNSRPWTDKEYKAFEKTRYERTELTVEPLKHAFVMFR